MEHFGQENNAKKSSDLLQSENLQSENLKVKLALSTMLEKFHVHILVKAKSGNGGALKALSMFTAMRPLINRELRNMSESDTHTLLCYMKDFIAEVEAQ